MTLALTLVLGTLALTALFWGVALLLQGYLYEQPVDRLPVRAAVGGLAVGLFLTGWAYVNTRASHKDKYGVLHEMNPTAVRDVPEFEAVRQSAIKDAAGKPRETTAAFRWQPSTAGAGGHFLEAGSGREFKLNTSDYVTVALLVPDGDGKKARFDAGMAKGQYVRTDAEPVTFREKGGSRMLTEENPHHMLVPSAGAMAGAVALNVLNFGLWFAVFWPVLRFSVGHALGLTALFGLTTMIVLMPLLFRLNEVKPAVG